MNLTIGPTIIGGETLTDDYTVREDGYGCGRVRLDSGPNNKPFWGWWINPPVPVVGKTTGQATSRDQAMADFKAAWAIARPSLTDDDVRHWHELEDGVRERFG
jgi:hypothetical protein